MISNDIDVLDRHKKDIICDRCGKRIWFFQKVVRCVVRMKENVWAEYYHMKCIEKGVQKRLKAMRKQKDKEEEGTSNTIRK